MLDLVFKPMNITIPLYGMEFKEKNIFESMSLRRISTDETVTTVFEVFKKN